MVVAVGQCSGCGSQTLEDDAYCQECGKFLGSEATDTKAPKPAPTVVAPHPDEFLTKLSPGSAKPVVALPVVAGAVALLLIIPCAIYGVVHSYESISRSYICDQAKKSVESGTPGAAVELLDRIALAHHGLTGNEKNILDRALFLESDQMITTGNYRRAKDDLQRISDTFTPVKEVRDRLQICDKYLASQAANASKAQPAADSHASRRTSRRLASNLLERARRSLAIGHSPQPALASSQVSPIAAAKVPPTTATADAKVSPPASTTDTKVSQTASTATVIAAPSATTTKSFSTTNVATSASAETSESKTSTVVAPTSITQNSTDKASVPTIGKPKKNKAASELSHADVARYNALLAGYFSSKSGDGELREPLSFREWVDKGKPKF